MRLLMISVFLFFVAFMPNHANGFEKKDKRSHSGAQSKKSLCAEFEGKYIVYYGKVFNVANCKRFELNSEQTYRLTQQKSGEIIEVESRVIAGIPAGGDFSDEKIEVDSVCKRYDKTYVTFSFVDVFWVENCVIREFPDWSSYEHHRGKLRNNVVALRALSFEDLGKLQKGEPMSSVIDEEFRELLRPDNIDLLPLAEACKGLIGRHVTYLGEVFEIVSQEKASGEVGTCAKKVVDAELFTRSKAGKKFQLAELSSSQSLSIPSLLLTTKK